jgi:hypothetical protein
LIISDRLSRLSVAQARAEAERLAAELGCRPEVLLRTRRNGFVVTFTSKCVIVGP